MMHKKSTTWKEFAENDVWKQVFVKSYSRSTIIRAGTQNRWRGRNPTENLICQKRKLRNESELQKKTIEKEAKIVKMCCINS